MLLSLEMTLLSKLRIIAEVAPRGGPTLKISMWRIALGLVVVYLSAEVLTG